MSSCSPFREYVENELNIAVLAELEAEHLRRRGEAIVDLLYCMDKLRRLRGDSASCASIAPTGRRG